MATLDGNSLGHVSSEKHNKKADLMISPVYLGDSNETDVWDFGGVIRTISIGGVYADSSMANVFTNFIDKIEALINGGQDNNVDFVSDSTDTYEVKIQSFDWDFKGGSPLNVNYTLQIVQSGSL